MEKRIELNLLLDCYGPLLTDSRGHIMRLFCEEDMSLQEIADELGITRQAVHDAIGRASDQLANYEQKLGVARRYREIQAIMADATEQLRAVRPTAETQSALDEALKILDRIEWIEG